MSVIHILNDGSTVNDISGRVVRLEDAGAIYQLLHKINTGNNNFKKTNICPPNSRGYDMGGGRLAQTV